MNLYLDKIWTLGSVFFSLGQFFCLPQDLSTSVVFSGVSVKMNVLLYSPALLAIFITQLGYARFPRKWHSYQRWYSRWNENGLQLNDFSVSLALWFKLASVPWYSPFFLLPGILTLKTYRFLHCNQKRTTLLHWHSIPQVQLVLAGPFLYQDPAAYFCGAFNFSRTFMHRFVNFLKVFPGFFLSVSAGICSK